MRRHRHAWRPHWSNAVWGVAWFDGRGKTPPLLMLGVGWPGPPNVPLVFQTRREAREFCQQANAVSRSRHKANPEQPLASARPIRLQASFEPVGRW